MKFTREINRLLLGVLMAFGIIAISAAYWAIVGPDTLLNRNDNPRLVEAQAEIIRGDIVDRNGELMVTSVQADNRRVSRQYLHPEANSALGYFSLRYGQGGAEAAFNAILRGDNLEDSLDTYLTQLFLHRPQVGSAIRLTFDLNIQKQTYEAMQAYSGAAVVMTVPDGDILALVSLPTYDPNNLDADWEILVNAPGNPFFNRVLQGSYQPGGMLETPLIAAALLNREISVPIENAADDVPLENERITCAQKPGTSTLTLLEAYVFACPRPFVELAQKLGETGVNDAITSFGLNQPVLLPGFIAENSPVAESTPAASPEVDLIREALGQGQLTVTPLNMAVVAAAVANNGNAPQPHTLLGIRPPGENEWTPVATIRPTIPITTAEIATQLSELMRAAVTDGAAVGAYRPGVDIGGHSALAYSGEGAQAWFIGFTPVGSDQGVVVAIVLENTDNPQLAAQIGGTVLEAAQQSLTLESRTES